MAATRPLLGYGLETFTARFPPFVSVELARAYPDFYHESPHNMFLDALASRGIPGMSSLLAICALAFWAASRTQNAPFAAALAGAIVCQQFMVLTIPTALYFYTLISMIIASATPAPQEETVRAPRAFMALALAIGMVFLIFATRLLLADRSMARAERLTELGDVAGASSAYRGVIRWELYPSADLRYSRAMTRLAAASPVFATSVAAAQQALDSGIRATETAEDRQNAWYNLAAIAALRKDRARVEQGLRSAIVCAPNWFKPHWTLSQFLERTGRHAEARREAARALELDGDHDPEVAETSQSILRRH
jgi:tetratricopeptide (TPR) repeat protein